MRATWRSLWSVALLVWLNGAAWGDLPPLWKTSGATKITPSPSKILTTNQQVEVTVADGTAPFNITLSTTKSANLHADRVDFVSIAGPTANRTLTLNDADADLSVTGSPTFAGLTAASVTGGTGVSGTLTLTSTSNATKGNILFGTSAYDEVNNRLGIGTTSPTRDLHVFSSTASAFARIESSFADGSAELMLKNDARLWSVSNAGLINDSFIIADETALANRFCITSTGKVGINNTDPQAIFHVHGGGITERMRLAHDAGNYASFSVTATGALTIASVGTPSITLSSPTTLGSTLNKVTITAPATSATLTLVDGGSLITAGAFATTLTSTATTNATLPSGTNTLYSTKSASITSAQLLASVSDETGTGAAVFATAPTITLDNATGLQLGTGVTGSLPVANGGTGQTTYTNGQLLIGNTTGNTLTKATLTGTASQVVVTNSTGAITLSLPQSIATTSSPTFNTLTATVVKSAGIAALLLGDTITMSAWTTSGSVLRVGGALMTDTSSTGTQAAGYDSVFLGNTIAASSATTFTNYVTAYFQDPSAGTNVTLANKWALGADSLRVGTSSHLTVTSGGVLTATSPVFTTPNLGTPSAVVLTNASGTASININGTVGATTPAAGAFTILSSTGATTLGDATGDTVTFNADTWTLPTSIAAAKTSQATTAEVIQTWTVSDDATSSCQVVNAVATDGQFSPQFKGTQGGTLAALSFSGVITTDTGTAPGMAFLSSVSGGTNVVTRPLFQWRNLATNHMTLAASGNLGIGTTTPTAAKLCVFSGTAPQLDIQNTAAIHATVGVATTTGVTTISALGGSTPIVDLVGTSGVSINTGSPVKKLLTNTAALDFGSIAAGATAELTITVTGCAAGDTVVPTPNGSPEANLTWSGHCNAANTVTIRLYNGQLIGAIDPASRTWRATILAF